MGAFQSTKIIELGSCAFRQPFADSHCRWVHGYQLTAKFWFGCYKLDDNNWAIDFGGLKELKKILRDQFDHTLVVSGADPALEQFQALHDQDVVDLRVMPDGVGIEKFAEWCFNEAQTYVKRTTDGRCFVSQVEVFEHQDNSAVYKP